MAPRACRRCGEPFLGSDNSARCTDGRRNGIVGHGEEAPDLLLANPRNWRVHPSSDLHLVQPTREPQLLGELRSFRTMPSRRAVEADGLAGAPDHSLLVEAAR